MAETLATTFELGHRALLGTRHVGAIDCQVAIARRRIHHFEHVLGVVFPVCGHVQYATDLQLAAYQLGERRLDDTALVVPRFVPGVGEEQQHAI